MNFHKKLINIATFALIVLSGVFLPGCKDDETQTTWEYYKDWREFNQTWLNEQIVKTNDDGTAFYTRCVMPTDPQAVVYMHTFGEPNTGNLQPMFTSTTKVNYTLTLANDSVLDSGAGFVSQLNSSNLITGWSLAIMQMHVGDTAQFVLPYNVGYGSTGSTNLPPYSNLQFNIRLLDITGYEIQP